jgi:X-X-X-Leu-X-X-Gly heptad repeat protein
MGVLNNDIVKWGVDALTGLLNGINALTSGFDTLNTGAGKFLNTFAKLTLLIGGLKVGKGLAAGLFGSILSAVTGGKVGGGFVNLAAGAMGISPGKNFSGTLGAGAINPFKDIAKGIGGKLSGIGFNAINANYAGSSALSGKLAAGVFGKLSGTGMATGAA